jgi:hypothetical protein
MRGPAQIVVGSQFRHLRSSRLPVGVPLRGRRAILESATSRGRIATELPRDRRRGPANAPSDVTNPNVLGVQDGRPLSMTLRHQGRVN